MIVIVTTQGAHTPVLCMHKLRQVGVHSAANGVSNEKEFMILAYSTFWNQRCLLSNCKAREYIGSDRYFLFSFVEFTHSFLRRTLWPLTIFAQGGGSLDRTF